MPESVERCVKKLMADPGFKPRKGRSKKESAWAICTHAHNRKKNQGGKK